jgi:hypothetical protein
MKRLASLSSRWLMIMFVSLGVISALSFSAVGAVDFFEDVCNNAGTGASEACTTDDTNNISGSDGIVLRAANLIAILGGIAAVIMIILGGFNMITGGGDSSKVGTAKKTIVYAVVGIIVISLSRLIVGFIVTRVG